MAVYPGRDGVVYLSATGTGTATQVIKLTEWSLDQSRDKTDVTSFGDANKTYVVGMQDVSGTFKGFFDDTETKPFTGASSADGVKFYLYPSANVPTKYKCGPAWMDVSITTAVSGAVAISGKFAANGSWANSSF